MAFAQGDYTTDNSNSSIIDVLAGAQVDGNRCVFAYQSAASPKNYRFVLATADRGNIITLNSAPHTATSSADEEFSRCDLVAIGDDLVGDPRLCAFYMDDTASHALFARRLVVNDLVGVGVDGNQRDLSDSGQQDHVAIDKIDDSIVMTAHNKWVFPDGSIRIWILTVSGDPDAADPISQSLGALTVSATAKLDRPIGAACISTTRAFVFYPDDDGDIYTALIDTSDNTVGAALVDGPDSLYTASVNSSVRSRQKKAVAISSTVAVYTNGSKIVAVENVADVITPGTEIDIQSGRTALSLAHVGGGKVIATGTGPSGSLQFLRSYSVSGTTITDNSDEIQLSQPPVSGAGVCATSATNKVIVAMGTGGDVGSFEANDIEFAEIRADPYGFRHPSLGLPGVIIT